MIQSRPSGTFGPKTKKNRDLTSTFVKLVRSIIIGLLYSHFSARVIRRTLLLSWTNL